MYFIIFLRNKIGTFGIPNGLTHAPKELLMYMLYVELSTLALMFLSLNLHVRHHQYGQWCWKPSSLRPLNSSPRWIGPRPSTKHSWIRNKKLCEQTHHFSLTTCDHLKIKHYVKYDLNNNFFKKSLIFFTSKLYAEWNCDKISGWENGFDWNISRYFLFSRKWRKIWPSKKRIFVRKPWTCRWRWRCSQCLQK